MSDEKFATVFKKTTNWYFTLAPIVLFYLAIAIYVMFKYHPVSRFFPFPPNSVEALFGDLVFVMSPLVGATIYYVVKLNNAKKIIRKKFTLDYQNDDLVYHGHNPNLIYLVLERNSSDGVSKMQVIWTPEGNCIDGEIYKGVVGTNLKTFDPTRFEHG